MAAMAELDLSTFLLESSRVIEAYYDSKQRHSIVPDHYEALIFPPKTNSESASTMLECKYLAWFRSGRSLSRCFTVSSIVTLFSGWFILPLVPPLIQTYRLFCTAKEKSQATLVRDGNWVIFILSSYTVRMFT